MGKLRWEAKTEVGSEERETKAGRGEIEVGKGMHRRAGARAAGGRGQTAGQTDRQTEVALVPQCGRQSLARCPQNVAAGLEWGGGDDITGIPYVSLPMSPLVPPGCWWGPRGMGMVKVTSTSAAWDSKTPPVPRPTSVPRGVVVSSEAWGAPRCSPRLCPHVLKGPQLRGSAAALDTSG